MAHVMWHFLLEKDLDKMQLNEQETGGKKKKRRKADFTAAGDPKTHADGAYGSESVKREDLLCTRIH